MVGVNQSKYSVKHDSEDYAISFVRQRTCPLVQNHVRRLIIIFPDKVIGMLSLAATFAADYILNLSMDMSTNSIGSSFKNITI